MFALHLFSGHEDWGLGTDSAFEDPERTSTVPARIASRVVSWVRAKDLLSNISTSGEAKDTRILHTMY